MPVFAAEQVVNGVNGILEIDGNYVGNVMNITANVNIERRNLNIAGLYGASYKRMGWTGEGTLVVWRVNSMFFDPMREGIDSESGMPEFDLRLIIKDPDLTRVGTDFLNGNNQEDIMLKKVKFWTFDWGFNIEELLDQNIEFTFEAIHLASALGTSGIDGIYYDVPESVQAVTGGNII